MKRIILVVACMLLLPAGIFAEEPAEPKQNVGDLTVVIVGLKNNKGNVKVMLANSKENFPSRRKDNVKPFRSDSAAIQDNKAEVVFKELPFGEYAIRLFHDENGNDKFDRNFLGIPKEDFAFSNNVKGKTGPPKYEDAKFEFKAKSMTIEITVGHIQQEN